MCTGWHRRVAAILVRGELWGVSSEWFVSYNVLAGAVQHSARSVGGCSGLFWFLQPLSQPQPQLSPWWWGTEMLETNKCASEPSPSLGLNSPAPWRTTCSLLGKVWPRAVGELRCPTLACTSLGSLERNHLDIKQNWIRVKWIFLTYTNLKKIQYIIYFHNELRNATRSQKSGVEWIPSRIIIIQRIILGHKIGSGDSSVLINHWGHQQCSCTLSRPIPGHAWNKNTELILVVLLPSKFSKESEETNKTSSTEEASHGVLADPASVTVVTSLQIAQSIKFPWPLGSKTKTTFTLTTHL